MFVVLAGGPETYILVSFFNYKVTKAWQQVDIAAWVEYSNSIISYWFDTSMDNYLQ